MQWKLTCFFVLTGVKSAATWFNTGQCEGGFHSISVEWFTPRCQFTRQSFSLISVQRSLVYIYILYKVWKININTAPEIKKSVYIPDLNITSQCPGSPSAAGKASAAQSFQLPEFQCWAGWQSILVWRGIRCVWGLEQYSTTMIKYIKRWMVP